MKPRRTIRVALWTGEEQDYFGSMGYVARHFGDIKTMGLKPEQAKLSAYFNLDNGSGRIRGVNLQGNEAVRPIFEAWLRPFNYLGATTLTTLNTGGTDHIPFDAIGLPGFQFIQDPLNYESKVHHSNLDVYEEAVPDDLKQASAILASFVYHAAMRDAMLPRKPLPKPHTETKAQPGNDATADGDDRRRAACCGVRRAGAGSAWRSRVRWSPRKSRRFTSAFSRESH